MTLNVEYAAIAQCNPEHVWQVFEQIELWPRWDPQGIREVRWVSGTPWTKGAKFSIELLKPKPFKLTPEVLEVDLPIYLHLRGQGAGVTGEQFYIFKWMPEQQSTELRTLQEFKGGPVHLFGKAVKPAIAAGIQHMFARITEEAEALARRVEQREVSMPAVAPLHAPPVSDPAPQPEDPPAR